MKGGWLCMKGVDRRRRVLDELSSGGGVGCCLRETVDTGRPSRRRTVIWRWTHMRVAGIGRLQG